MAKDAKGPVTRFDLEDPRTIARLADPMLALASLEGLVILDEIQHARNCLQASESSPIVALSELVSRAW